MLYPQSRETELRDDLFRNPTSEYRGVPFWAWNGHLDRDELLWQLEVLKKMGFGGAHMHVRTGVTTPYLSDEHMELVRDCVEKCRNEQMGAWLYDEDRWPSGAAGGIVTKDPQYRARFLLITPRPYSGKRKKGISFERSGAVSRTENGYLLTCFDILLDERGCLKRAVQISPEAEAEGSKWYVYVETPEENPWFNNQTYLNTLDPKAVRRFIEVTYRRFLDTVGDQFGAVIPAIFTDEPQFSRKSTLAFAAEHKDVVLPWTEDMPRTFMDAYGEDLIENLPQLLWELPDGQVSAVRYHYHDHTCERFTKAFADQCGAWCEKHGLMLTGHMMNEATLSGQTMALGEVMRSYRSFQLPGVDMLCDKVELTTVKQAQSASRQYGREGLLSELYGVTGWDFDFRGHKFQGDWQAALGVTVRVPHLSWFSMKGEAKRDFPASIHYQSPWWQDYSYVEDHFARLNTALTRGKPLVKVGVIHPIESFWLHYGPGDQTLDIRNEWNRRFRELTKWLLCGSLDFDFISESLLPGQCPAGGAPLTVGAMAYDAIVVPGCETLRSTTLDRLEAFLEAGGRLIFLGEAPKYEDAVGSSRGEALWKRSEHADFSEEAMIAALETERLVEIRDDSGRRTANLIHQLRTDGADLWLFVAHCEKPYHRDVPVCRGIRICLKGQYDLLRYDTLTGQICPLKVRREGGKTIVSVQMYDLDSLLLRYVPVGTAVCADPPRESVNLQYKPVPSRVSYTLDEPNAYLLDKAEFALDGEPYRPEKELLRIDDILRQQLGWPDRSKAVAQPWTLPDAPADHRVRLSFRVNCAIEMDGIDMALEDAGVARIFLNGERVTAAPHGWYTDKSIEVIHLGHFRRGENRVEVELPFGRRTNIEWCYLLGRFGVEVAGEYRELVPPREKLGFDDITKQGLAHYGGNITYHIPLITEGGNVTVTVPHYAGAAVKAELDGKHGYVVYPPYSLKLENISPGEHILNLTLLGNRRNGFGPVHLADPQYAWLGPKSWRTEGSRWTDSYRLVPIGIMTAPTIGEEK